VYLQPLVYIRLSFPVAVIATTLEFIIPMFLIAQHVSSETSLIIRNSKSVFAVSGLRLLFPVAVIAMRAAGNHKHMYRGCKYTF
jgi:hypothetical protein